MQTRRLTPRARPTYLDSEVRAQLGQEAAAEALRLAVHVAPHRHVRPRQRPRQQLVQRPAFASQRLAPMRWQQNAHRLLPDASCLGPQQAQ